MLSEDFPRNQLANFILQEASQTHINHILPITYKEIPLIIPIICNYLNWNSKVWRMPETKKSTQHQKMEEKNKALLISVYLTAGSRPQSSGFHYLQEVPPFGTISELHHKGFLLGWHNSSVPTHYMNTCMTSYHMNTCTASLLYEHMPLII